jgi:hypothetical protein
MSTMLILLLVGAAYAGYYFVYLKRGGGAGTYQRLYELGEGESVVGVMAGYTVIEPSLAQVAGAAALGARVASVPLHIALTTSNSIIIHINGSNQRIVRRNDMLEIGAELQPEFLSASREVWRLVAIDGHEVMIKDAEVGQLQSMVVGA